MTSSRRHGSNAGISHVVVSEATGTRWQRGGGLQGRKDACAGSRVPGTPRVRLEYAKGNFFFYPRRSGEGNYAVLCLPMLRGRMCALCSQDISRSKPLIHPSQYVEDEASHITTTFQSRPLSVNEDNNLDISCIRTL